MGALRPESWAVLGAAVLGIVAAGMAFVKTPPERRFRIRPPTLEQRVAAAPPGESVVIIRADRRRAFRRDLPWLLAMVPMAAFAIWWTLTDNTPCASLLGIGRARWAVILLWVIPPIVLGLAILQALVQLRGVLRGGYWPPLDTPLYADALARSGPMIRRRAQVLGGLLVLLIAVTSAGYAESMRFLLQGEAWGRLAAAEVDCASR